VLGETIRSVKELGSSWGKNSELQGGTYRPMNTIQEYLDNTETAVRIIINGINAYVGLLNDNRPPVYVVRPTETLELQS